MKGPELNTDNLPKELCAQLAWRSNSEYLLVAGSTRQKVLTILAEEGTPMDFNHILVGLYEKYNTVFRRQSVTSTCHQLAKRGFTEKTGVGIFRITDAGRKALEGVQ